MSLRTDDYDFALPESLIARWPLPDRAASRMMCCAAGEQRIEDNLFQNFTSFLQEGRSRCLERYQGDSPPAPFPMTGKSNFSSWSN